VHVLRDAREKLSGIMSRNETLVYSMEVFIIAYNTGLAKVSAASTRVGRQVLILQPIRTAIGLTSSLLAILSLRQWCTMRCIHRQYA